MLGEDPQRAEPGVARAARRRAPVVVALPEADRAREPRASSPATTRARATRTRSIEIVGLAEKADARCRTLSGGQKRRLDLGLALVGNPELVFLDEPTTGFDPGARRAAWETIRNLRSLGTTILLTTHYLDEAEQLSDRVAVLREGGSSASGTPAELTGGDARDRDPLPPRTASVDRRADDRADEPPLRADRRGGRARRGARDLEVRRPTLEDVYLELTGDGAVRLFVHELRAEQLLFWRNREAAIFTFFLPVVFFLIFGVGLRRTHGSRRSTASAAPRSSRPG